MHMCLNWEGKSQIKKRLGSLMHVTKCVRSSRPFLNRMLQTLREAKDSDHIVLEVDFYRDLLWFQKFLPHFNGVCLYDHQAANGIIQIDASLHGLGGRWGNVVYQLRIPLGMDSLGIVRLEMLNVYLAL